MTKLQPWYIAKTIQFLNFPLIELLNLQTVFWQTFESQLPETKLVGKSIT